MLYFNLRIFLQQIFTTGLLYLAIQLPMASAALTFAKPAIDSTAVEFIALVAAPALSSPADGDVTSTITTAETPVTKHAVNSDTEKAMSESEATKKAVDQFMDDLANQPNTFNRKFSIGFAYVYNIRLLNSKLKKDIPDPHFSNWNQHFPNQSPFASDHTENFSNNKLLYDTNFRIFVRSPEIPYKNSNKTFYRLEAFYEKRDVEIDRNPLNDAFDYEDSSQKLRLFDNVGLIFQSGYYIIPSKLTFYGGLGVQSFKYELEENLVYSTIFSPAKSSSGSKADRSWGVIIALGMDYYFNSHISANFFMNGSLNFIDGTSAKIPQVDEVFGEAYIPNNSPGMKYKLFSYTSGIGLSFHF